jgi:hypothetical protein
VDGGGGSEGCIALPRPGSLKAIAYAFLTQS